MPNDITFPHPLVMRYRRGVHGTFELYQDFIMHRTGDRSIVVPEGFITDGASIPPIFRWALPRWGRYGEAAVVHDFLYDRLSTLQYPLSRRQADQVFNQAMSALGCRWYRRIPMWLIVRAFAWVAWKKPA